MLLFKDYSHGPGVWTKLKMCAKVLLVSQLIKLLVNLSRIQEPSLGLLSDFPFLLLSKPWASCDSGNHGGDVACKFEDSHAKYSSG
eukprot:1159671-Pelagomonas_calceolata.AAC.2